MKRFFIIFLVLLVLTYFCMSVFGSSWDPVKWTSDVKPFVVLFLLMDAVIAFFIHYMFD